jgi:hypothetical protein
MIESPPHPHYQERLLTGFGIPCPIVVPLLEPVDGVRITYREGGEWVRRDLEDVNGTEVVLRGRTGPLLIEAVKRSAGSPGTRRSTSFKHPVDVRGVLPLCGNETAPGGHRDGLGRAARFQEPFGLAHLLRWFHCSRSKPILLVTDRASHVLRTVTADGEVATLCGQPGEAGHRDSPTLLERMGAAMGGLATQQPLFHSPTHVTLRRIPGGVPFSLRSEEAVVADSGNHVIRTVAPGGKVGTLAGTPGRAGCRDSAFPTQAAFNDPQGVAADAEGRVYVADRGNRVIRVIQPDGAVTTLAGSPGEAGSSDSPARFTDLKGLCLHPRLALLFVLDGHALRQVSLPGGGQVRTLLGVVDAPGFRDVATGEAATQPCLNDPTGIFCARDGICIADHGNNAVRMVSLDARSMGTLAGDPGLCATRWGLVRDGVGTLDERYGALEGPWTVTGPPVPDGGEGEPSLYTTSGRCLADIHHALGGRRGVDLTHPGPALEAVVDEAVTLPLRVEQDLGTCQFRVDYVEPDGEMRLQAEGELAPGPEATIRSGWFTQPGEARMVIVCVTGEGVSAQAEVAVRVRP